MKSRIGCYVLFRLIYFFFIEHVNEGDHGGVCPSVPWSPNGPECCVVQGRS